MRIRKYNLFNSFAMGLLGALVLLISACSQESNPVDQPPVKSPPEPKTYIELGDLEAIRKQGSLRLVAPRFDGTNSLLREGIPMQHYHQIAEAFAQELQLDVQWIFVDDFSALIPTLLRGEADVIVTNMSVTPLRREQVLFSRPINEINEVLISLSENVKKDPEQLSGLTLSVPEGTAYIDTLKNLSEKNQIPLNLTITPSGTSHKDLLDAIQAGKFQATVLDSDLASRLLMDYPGLSASLVLRRHRPIAWATRKGSSKLLNQLNEFLVSHHLQASANKQQRRSWVDIKQAGRLRMLTLNNPASYFMWRGELMGFDLDLMKEFAKQHQLQVSVILKNTIPELITALQEGEGDVIAASLTQSSLRESMGLQFSRPYLKVNEQLVGRKNGPSVSSVEQLTNQKIGVNPETVFYTAFKELQAQGIDLQLQEFPKSTTESLMNRLVTGEFDFAAVDSHLFAIEIAHRDDLQLNLELKPVSAHKGDIAWGLRPDQVQLREKLNAFIKQEYRGLFYNVTFNKYFKNTRRMRQHKAERVVPGADLSPFDDLIKPLAKQYGMDWRLIVSQMYQESKFQTKAKSFAGAMGLMQVMPRTARELGYKDLEQAENGIGAGMAYMNWLEQRFPGELDMQERIFFTLAAYNAGAGHVRDARRLAQQLGKNPNRWFGHVEDAMLLLAKPKFHKKARFGYVRGSEPVQYVKEIRARYLGYLQVK